MRKRMSSTLLVASISLLALFSSSAIASSTHGGTASRASKVAAKGITRTKYTLSYTDEKFGPVACKGVHIVSPTYPGTATSGGADKFKCKSTTGKALTFGKPGEKLPENFTEWQSDYFAGKGLSVIAKSLNATMSGPGKSYKGFAVYPSPEEEQAAKEKAEKEAKEKAEKEQLEKEEKEKEEEEKEEGGE